MLPDRLEHGEGPGGDEDEAKGAGDAVGCGGAEAALGLQEPGDAGLELRRGVGQVDAVGGERVQLLGHADKVRVGRRAQVPNKERHGNEAAAVAHGEHGDDQPEAALALGLARVALVQVVVANVRQRFSRHEQADELLPAQVHAEEQDERGHQDNKERNPMDGVALLQLGNCGGKEEAAGEEGGEGKVLAVEADDGGRQHGDLLADVGDPEGDESRADQQQLERQQLPGHALVELAEPRAQLVDEVQRHADQAGQRRGAEALEVDAEPHAEAPAGRPAVWPRHPATIVVLAVFAAVATATAATATTALGGKGKVGGL
eukprot:m.97521 g.97521  ORF g.97521 m.97521 type:complete len:317 (+) comp15533_c1_seq3:447-1397(+)